MRSLYGIIDASLCLALPVIAWRSLAATRAAVAAVLFIAFGLLAALAWARLDAPDVALVEAALGAGVTGALLMSALSWLDANESGRPGYARGGRLALSLSAGALAVALIYVVRAIPGDSAGLREPVLRELDASGVAHGVTAVLLNFRGYDTLLEIAVLVVVSIAVRPGDPGGADATGSELNAREAVLRPLVRTLLPGIIVVAGYLLWRGSSAPGGAFQAGSILAGGGILLLCANVLSPASLRGRSIRVLACAGLGVFVVVAVMPPILRGDELLEYPRRHAGTLIFLIEAALALSIGAILVLFVAAAWRTTDERDGGES